MNTKINLTYNNEDYTLEFDRMTIKLLEKTGFQYEEFMTQPMTNVELAFAAAFIKNHPKIKQTTLDEIYASCPNKNELIAALSIMINECYETLLADPEEDKSGNAKWEIVSLSEKKKETQE